ncbi:hypothetical protein AD930_10725 [Acetobacter malorum]|nr:hypothetical protein AD930_10725 [Acetobacter malorum]
MHEKLIRKWNNVVQNDDHVIHVGDLILGSDVSILAELNGHIHVCTGNHDTHSTMNKALRAGYIASVQSYMGCYISGKMYHFQHFPTDEWPYKNKGAILVHGHMHNRHPPTENSIDVGVDTPWANFAPIFVERIPSLLQKYGPKASQ